MSSIAPRERRATLALALLLSAAAGAVYLPVAGFSFVNWDDPLYVTGNAKVLSGLTREGFAWAFTSLGYASNWHPLAWLSHMLDVQLFGVNAGGHHLTSLLLHLACTVLIFLFFTRATGARSASAFVAGLFALHPLHVEAVAWVSERKEVLAAAFWFLTLAAWLGWLRRRGAARYLLAVALFALALLSKPMAVTLPFVLLLLDWWPLGRVWRRAGEGWGSAAGRLLGEKAPLFALSAASSWLTYAAQQKGGALVAGIIPFGQRAANALLACGWYLGKMLLPTDLAPFYPYPAHAWTPGLLWQAAAAGAAILVLSASALALARRVPSLAVGWFWYLGTLVPVSGLVQVGMQSRADRYTYLPLTGIFLAAAFGIAGATRALPRRRALLAAGALVALSAAGAAARAQVGHWRETFTLFEQILRVHREDAAAPGIAPMHFNLGSLLMQRGRPAEALEHLLLGIRGRPASWEGHYMAGDAYLALGRPREAEAAYRETIRLNPGAAGAWNNLGAVLFAAGRQAEAERAYRETIRRDPRFAGAHLNLGRIMSARGNAGEAAAHFREALRLEPGNQAARLELQRLGPR